VISIVSRCELVKVPALGHNHSFPDHSLQINKPFFDLTLFHAILDLTDQTFYGEDSG